MDIFCKPNCFVHTHFFPFNSEANEGVQQETDIIMSTPLTELVQSNHFLVVREASKYLGNEFSIDKITFGVKKGQCFGLLGLEQAGKSSVLKMIAGSIPLTTGTVYIDGFDCTRDPLEVQDKIGLSCGIDALLQKFTVEETLNMYAHIRGIPRKEIPGFIEDLTGPLSLKPNVMVKNLNNIEKRKLSVAVAILGTPPLILLDEPTFAMDLVAIKQTTEIIKRAVNTGCTVFMTSQRVKECQELCKRIGILVKGKMTYIGDFDQLNKQYEGGITLMLKIKKSRKTRTRHTRRHLSFQGYADDVKGVLETELPDAVLKIELLNYLDYFLPKRNLKWSKLFAFLERLKLYDMLDDYSLYDTTFEHSFAYLVNIFEADETRRLTEFLKARKLTKF